ncbi:hypothetical protein AJ80_03683 [Polytolypa hystricis UAMH7299]|uniref:RTA1 domain-containing protein n=1 Tax=Polytolypa hystricis (strain UAMH7299) TaxID=1447883 RepID=A0A2B7YFR0_POLH7|nr:hypothetical protein AJ80_03683 [Polytolypa hystricis UAMH7299]
MAVPLNCTLAACPIEWGYVHYQPSVPGNAFMLAAFGALIPPSIYLGWKYKTHLFTGVFVIGLLAEVVGYVGRIMLHDNPFFKDYFLIYLINLTLGPTVIAAAIYLTLARIVVVYGEEISRIRPRTYTLLFSGFDFLALIVQAAGGGMAAVAWIQADIDRGTYVLVAGLSIQVVSLLTFMGMSAEFAWRVRRRGASARHADLRRTAKFQTFLGCLALATVLLFIRSVFRVVELSEGFAGHLAQDQVSFMVLDGVMVLVAVILLTVMHPGFAFGPAWTEAAFRWRVKKATSAPELELQMEATKSNAIGHNTDASHSA